jgi:cbb3-type cytochrome oxidase subunit 3
MIWYVFFYIGLFFICGILFILVATLIGIFKKEKDIKLEDNYAQPRVTNSYKLLWDIIKLPNLRVLLIALLTMKVIIQKKKIGIYACNTRYTRI